MWYLPAYHIVVACIISLSQLFNYLVPIVHKTEVINLCSKELVQKESLQNKTNNNKIDKCIMKVVIEIFDRCQ